ncbi:DUF4185 domain-containing protein [Luteipulveratus mongoliensis]|uniref:DUF4185 domain-containing protein n=1 Tax=Luteipulveratus mongoliensis TaxID=571913 RepID=UPI00069816DF|nr:DUF4185 domain-containing protein [Luteipulveratus mongoliensis]
MRRTSLAAVTTAIMLTLVTTSAGAVERPDSPGHAASRTGDDAPPSTFIGTSSVESHESVTTKSDGDLWPSCWAANDTLYSANGDGKGFSTDGEFSDIAVSEIRGTVPSLSGTTIARGDQIGSVWSGEGYNRKPTGMVCDGNTIYLAVQDLALDFNDVPAASIVKSVDGGRTWTWDRSKPMFSDHEFTTVWFADFGRGKAAAPDGYVYAYGLDDNWRDSFDDTVPDPQDLFLARVPKAKIQNRGAWQFYRGLDAKRNPLWSKRIGDKQPIMHDGRRLYEQTYSGSQPARGFSVVSQGGVTYDAPLKRYLYASWTEFTYEFYESPTPWGPWKHFQSKDFGGYPWAPTKYGGYGTTMPSKFMSADGRSLYVQSNVCPCAPAGTSVYHYSLRKLELTPSDPTPLGNVPAASTDLALPATGAVAVSKSSRSGTLSALNDGDPATAVDDLDDEVKSQSWWGYTWPSPRSVNRVQLTTGPVTEQGGWFTARPRVQLKNDQGQWVDAAGQTISPTYPGDASAGAGKTYDLSFVPATTSGVRVLGFPGGSRTFTSVAALKVGYATQVADAGFESLGGPSAWSFEGTTGHGVDRGLGFAHTGANNGWIRTSGTGWSEYNQSVPVQPGHRYTFGVWTKSSAGMAGGRLEVRTGGLGTPVVGSAPAPASGGYVQHQVTVTAPPGATSLTVAVGFTGSGADQFLQLDDVTATEG